jgi:hypothetical protein
MADHVEKLLGENSPERVSMFCEQRKSRPLRANAGALISKLILEENKSLRVS